MAASSSSSSASVLRNGGAEVDTASLERELVASLEEDRVRTATDEVKKRAVHTSASYEEFRNRVLCAHLQPVSQEELRTLGDERRGWKHKHRGLGGAGLTATTGSAAGNVSATTAAAGGEAEGGEDEGGIAGMIRRAQSGSGKSGGKNGKTKKKRRAPGGHGRVTDAERVEEERSQQLRSSAANDEAPLPRSAMEFERDWRRFSGSKAHKHRVKYLKRVGTDNAAQLFRTDMDVTLLEAILRTLLQERTALLAQTVPAAEGTGDRRSQGATVAKPVALSRVRRWLCSLPTFGRYELNLEFLDTELRTEFEQALEEDVAALTHDARAAEARESAKPATGTENRPAMPLPEPPLGAAVPSEK